MTYVKQNWENLPSENTPITAERLAHMETQYDKAVTYTDANSHPPALPVSIEFKKWGDVPYSVVRIAGENPGKFANKFYGSPPEGFITTRTLDWYGSNFGQSVVSNASGWLAAGGARGMQIWEGVGYNDWYPTGDIGVECLSQMWDGSFTSHSKFRGDTQSSMILEGVRNTWSFGPAVVRSGLVVDIDSDPARWPFFAATGASAVLSARKLVGQTGDGHIVIISVQGASSVSGIVGNAMGQLALSEGCIEAVCLDGGGSSQTVVTGKWVQPSSDATLKRGVADVLSFGQVSLTSGVMDEPWQPLELASGFGVQSGETPEWSRVDGVLYFRGLVNRTGGFAPSTSYPAVVNVPKRFPSLIQRPYNRSLSGHTADSSVRGLVNPSGGVNLVTGAVAPAYVDLSGLSGITQGV